MGDTGGGAGSQDERSRRQNALSAIARAVGADEPETPKATQRRGFGGVLPQVGMKRTGVIVISALIVFAVVVAGVYGYQRYTRSIAMQAAPIPKTLRIDLMASKLYCPEYIAWSPDSLSLAVIAYAEDCGIDTGNGPSAQDQALAIFNARTGALEKRAGIASALATSNLTGLASAVAWSRDGRSVYVICTVQSPTGQAGSVGLLVVPVRSSHTQLYVSSLTEFPQAGEIWSVKGRPSATALSQAITPSLSYTWSQGRIMPEQPFSTDLTHFTGVASLPGGFSFWQAGTITPSVPAQDSGSDAKTPPMALLYNSLVNQSSPDGDSFVSGLLLSVRIPAPSPPAPEFNPKNCLQPIGGQPCPTEIVPLPDKALAEVARKIEQGIAIGGGYVVYYSACVAWRPDGKLLAALLPGQGFDVNNSKAVITIFDANTGAILGHVSAERTIPNGSLDEQGLSPIQWSPSGQQIALVDYASSAITIWDARSLRA